MGGRLESKNLGVWTKIWVRRSQGRESLKTSGAQGQRERLAKPHLWAEGHLSGQTFLAGWEVRGHFFLHLKLALPRALFPP